MSMFTRLGFRSDSDDWVVSWESLGSWMQTRFEVSVSVDESANKTFFSHLLNVCLRNPWDAMKPLEYLLSSHLNLLTPPWPLNCFKVSGNRCSRIQKVPQGICWSAGVCQTVSPQKTQKKNVNIPAWWASGSATPYPREPLRAGGFSASVAFGLRPAVNLSQEVPVFLAFLRRASCPSWRHAPAEQNTICCLSEDPEGGSPSGVGDLSLHLLRAQCVKCGLSYDFCIGKSFYTAHICINQSVYTKYNKK